MKNKYKIKTYDEVQEEFDKWLDECPVEWTDSTHPTSFIETYNFDFTKYDMPDGEEDDDE